MNSKKSFSRFSKKIMTKKEKKVTLQVLISADLYKKLVELAPQLYGTTRGSLSYVVEEALRLYLEPRLHAQTHTNPARKVRLVYSQVVEQVKQILNISFAPHEVPEKILDLAISEVRGSDPRTVEKWKSTFLKMGLARVVGGLKPNRVFELIA